MTDQTADFDADQIVPTSINADARVDETPAQKDNDQRWVETVLDSLSTRSCAAREALKKALLDGQDAVTSVSHVSGLELKTRESAKNPSFKLDTNTNRAGNPLTHHVSGTISPKIIDLQRSGASSRPRCSTDVSHTMDQASQLTVWESVTKTVSECRTADQRCCASLHLRV